ncbi:MAG: hypothetical protein KDD64_16360, partial [Bdellovibrionales bacterium]|nr:hypothetical protein [Bdellovibrionales bacterium]
EDYDLGEFRCSLFEDMEPKRHYDLRALNKFDPETLGMHGETNFEVYKMFSGCYGFPEKEDWCIQVLGIQVCDMIFRWFPSYFGNLFGDLRLR